MARFGLYFNAFGKPVPAMLLDASAPVLDVVPPRPVRVPLPAVAAPVTEVRALLLPQADQQTADATAAKAAQLLADAQKAAAAAKQAQVDAEAKLKFTPGPADTAPSDPVSNPPATPVDPSVLMWAPQVMPTNTVPAASGGSAGLVIAAGLGAAALLYFFTRRR